MRRVIPALVALVAPLIGVAAAFYFGTIDVPGLRQSGMAAGTAVRDAVAQLVSSPAPEPADTPDPAAAPEAAPPAWLVADKADAAVTPPAAPQAAPAIDLSAAAPAPAPAATAARNPNVHQATVATTVCRAGYTKRLRGSFAARYRAMLLASAAVPKEEWQHWQLDHRVPLALGGAARDASNLSLQPITQARRKDRLEVKLQCLVCTGQVPLHVARREVERDWQAAYHRYAKVKCKRPRKPRDRPAT